MLQNAVEDVLDVLGDLDHDCLVTRSVCTSMVPVSLPLTVTSVNGVIVLVTVKEATGVYKERSR